MPTNSQLRSQNEALKQQIDQLVRRIEDARARQRLKDQNDALKAELQSKREEARNLGLGV